MQRLPTRIDTTSDAFRANHEHNQALAEDLRARLNAARHERPASRLARLEEQGKLPVQQRLDLLLDPDSPFLEFSALAACEAYDGEAPRALVVTGIGVVQGREVVVIASDSSLKGGTWYPLTVHKIVRALEIALENRLPVVHLIDSGGAYLPLQDEIYANAGKIFHHQCLLSAAGVPQVAVVLGHCTAGAAYLPTLCDESIMVRGKAFVFLAGPPLVKAATGEEVSAEELGGADMHATVSGTADYAVDTEREALSLARDIIGVWAAPDRRHLDMREPEPPYHDPAELYGIIPDDIKKQFDMREVIARIVDGSLFHEFKPGYGTTLVTGRAFILGHKVGIIGNNGVLFSEAANKATQFMQLCDRDRIPLLFMHNITGFMVGREYERRGISKDGAKMLMVQANVTVPKLSLLAHASQGAGNYAMAGRTWSPRLLFAWPNSRSSIMGSQQATKTLTEVRLASLKRRGEEPTPGELAAIESESYEHFETTSHPYHLTSNLRDDGLIDPLDTRNTLGMALSAVSATPTLRTPGGVLRI
ncbi:MAG: methylcrotonoyl-CoA carboxylase [bacterium]|nr:methylcrotonoyl-CoA carboxylase [bacterium]